MRTLLFFLLLTLTLLSCGNDRTATTAEILTSPENAPSDPAKWKATQRQEALRVKKLLLSDVLLSDAITRSKLGLPLEEVKDNFVADNIDNTGLIRLLYSANDTNGAAAFLDTLLVLLPEYDVHPRLEEMNQQISMLDYLVLQEGNRLTQLEQIPDSVHVYLEGREQYSKLIEERAELSIRRAGGVVSRIRIVEWARPAVYGE